jgi:hypothetical protein
MNLYKNLLAGVGLLMCWLQSLQAQGGSSPQDLSGAMLSSSQYYGLNKDGFFGSSTFVMGN